MTDRIAKSDDEWPRLLAPERYRITRKKGTEPSFSARFMTRRRRAHAAASAAATSFSVRMPGMIPVQAGRASRHHCPTIAFGQCRTFASGYREPRSCAANVTHTSDTCSMTGLLRPGSAAA